MKLRALPALIGAVALTVSLAGCSSTNIDSLAKEAKCEPTPAGKISDAAKVTGDFGKTVTLKVDKASKITESQRTINTLGDGKMLVDGNHVSANVTMFSPEGESGGEPTPISLTLAKDSNFEALLDAATCAPVGSRVTVAFPAKQYFGEGGAAQQGLNDDDALFLVVDLMDAGQSLKKADIKDNFPTVKENKDGVPIVTLPKGDPSDELEIRTIEKGDGDVVGEGDTVKVNYQGSIWRDGFIFDDSWKRGSPAEFATTGVVEGFGKALVGQKVGSRVVVVIPPKYGYVASDTNPDGGNAGAGILPDDTMVFVIDIEGVTPAAAAQ
ncbi:FKBP-type peptidyl-prolyl cis-trans isomerase [Lysinibacter cavernae]|uniref:peptidylprolyl isomerase n=1 Tax=Lysinibacter cavernae TaxID=1640652 RepID=A0A7X5R118_9MICO|nr:peptidylprolyl isomerase [Lysinibacter cavernae]